jgi:16S rRNA (adenine1518-N6/adenine1519-N6)-dimethyltransferase
MSGELKGSVSLPSISEIVKAFNLLSHKGHSKSLGQNFLLDENFVRSLLRHIPSLEGENVLEIGPGAGSLTRIILEKSPKKLVALEADPQCCTALNYLTSRYNQLSVIPGDARKFTPQNLFEGGPLNIIANLPYNVGTHLLVQWLENLEGIKMMTLMFQKEVADRLEAKPQTEAYGRLSVLCQLLCEIVPLKVVPPSAFTPPPKVYSAMVALYPKVNRPKTPTLTKVSQLTQSAFSQRRKMIRSSLSQFFGDDWNALLEKLNLKETQRPEELTPLDFLALGENMKA